VEAVVVPVVPEELAWPLFVIAAALALLGVVWLAVSIRHWWICPLKGRKPSVPDLLLDIRERTGEWIREKTGEWLGYGPPRRSIPTRSIPTDDRS
jgi:hypothetical protein